MLFGVGVSCRILHSIVSYLNVSCSGSITLVGEERASLLVIKRGFLFLLVLGVGCDISMWHSLGLSYNYLTRGMHYVSTFATKTNTLETC